ncbi:MAG TPA: flippase-like domain-containing protein [Planctomycetota bacterium]|nr:flippase-like domain-containing protein [Planctomycetota bacterium]
MRRALGLAILLPVTGLLLLGIVWVVGFEETLRQVRRAGVWPFAAVGALTLVFIAVQATAWALLSRPIGHRVSYLTLVGATTVGQAGNMLTPSTYLGGEPLRVAYVGKMASLPYHEVAGTVLLSKYLEFLSFMLMFGFSAAVAAVEYKSVLFSPAHMVGGVAIVGVAVLMLGFSGVLWLALAQRRRPLSRLARALAWFRPLRRPIVRLRRRVAEMEDQASRTFCEEGRTSFAAFGAMLVSHAAVFAKPLAFFLLGGSLRLRIGELCLIFVAGQLLLAVQITPSGVGMLDGGLIGTFAILGHDSADQAAMVMAYLLCLRLWDVVVVSAGAFLAARVGARFFTSKPAGYPEPKP